MIIRKAAPGDRDILIELRGLMLESMMSDKLQEDDLKTIRQYFWEWDGEDPLCLVAEEEGPVVGSIAASFYNHFPGPGDPSGIRAIIHTLCVLPDHRGKGIGGKLVREMLRECRGKGVSRVSLYATDMGRPIFESFGFSNEPPHFSEMRLYGKDIENLHFD
jgi:GNAT superfamily N-acetyltransferase